MAFLPLSLFFDFVILIGLGIVFVLMEGIYPRIIAAILFISGISVAIGPQYIIIENNGVLTELTVRPYPTLYIGLLVWLHILLAYYAVALIFRDYARDPIGRKHAD